MRLLSVLLVALAGLAYSPSARACSCMKLTPEEGLTSSFAVFTGEVTNIEKNQSTRFGGLEVTLRVKEMWKGAPSPEIEVHTASSSAACGYHFQEGVTYLVYAIRDEADPMRVSLCSRTAPVENAKEDLAYLGKPKHTFDAKRRGCSVSPRSRHDASLPWSLLGVLAVVGLARRVV